VPDVEGGILAARKKPFKPPQPKKICSRVKQRKTPFPPGWEARLHGRQDACRYKNAKSSMLLGHVASGIRA